MKSFQVFEKDGRTLVKTRNKLFDATEDGSRKLFWRLFFADETDKFKNELKVNFLNIVMWVSFVPVMILIIMLIALVIITIFNAAYIENNENTIVITIIAVTSFSILSFLFAVIITGVYSKSLNNYVDYSLHEEAKNLSFEDLAAYYDTKKEFLKIKEEHDTAQKVLSNADKTSVLYDEVKDKADKIEQEFVKIELSYNELLKRLDKPFEDQIKQREAALEARNRQKKENESLKFLAS